MTPFLAFLGPMEILLILILLLLLFGAKKLPALARGMGKSVTEFKKGKEEMESGEKKPDSEKKEE